MSEDIKKFQIIFDSNDFRLIEKEAKKRNLSKAEFIRNCIKNEISPRSNYERILALKKISGKIN